MQLSDYCYKYTTEMKKFSKLIFNERSDYFAINGMLPLGAVLPLPFMCLYSHTCSSSRSDTVAHGTCRCLATQWLQAGIFAGRKLRQRQCTLGGSAQCQVV